MVNRSEIVDLFGVSFKRFLHDNFSSTEQMTDAITGSAIVTPRLFEVELSTQALQDSTAKVYYNFPGFNPFYSTLIFKLQFSSIADAWAFVGVKGSTDDPTDPMIESHAGYIFDSGKIYASTADGTNQQKILLADVIATNNILYRISSNHFSNYPLPIIYPYFDSIRVEKPTRKWSTDAILATYPPTNKDHYFVAFITNTVNKNKYLRIKHVTYGEEYAD